MKRDDVLQTLKASERDLRSRFGLDCVALFGSVARAESTHQSDVDLLVDFGRPVSLFDLALLQQHLQQLLGVPRVDLALRGSIIPALRESICGDSIYAFGEEMEVSR